MRFDSDKYMPDEELLAVFNERIPSMLQLASQCKQSKVVFGMCLGFLTLFDLPEQLEKELIIACGISVAEANRSNLIGLTDMLEGAGYAKEELLNIESAWQKENESNETH